MSPPKALRPEDAVDVLRPRDTLGLPLGPGLPVAFLHALGVRDDWDDLEVFGALLVDLFELFTRKNVRYRSGFFGPAERFLRDSGGAVEFVPADFRRFAPLLQALSPRVMATVATPPDAKGMCSLSLHAGATVAEINRAAAHPERVLVVEMNEKFPRTYGLPPEHRHAIHVNDIDVLIESDRDPFVLADPEPTDVDKAIAEHASTFIRDGCTLQTGIGAVPSTIAKLLADGDGGDYGVHSEMFTTGLMHLHQAGKVRNLKGVFDGFSVTTFAAGTLELYEWLDGREEVRFLPVEHVNAPEIIVKNRRMVTINAALMVDLFGQFVADTITGRQFSGIGGHEDFVSGTGLSLAARSLVCLPSTYVDPNGTVQSKIAPSMPSGNVVTTPRHQVDVIITEHGAAELRGLTVRERAEALAAIAHPDFRDRLFEAAAGPPFV